jgi:hypothetical protein
LLKRKSRPASRAARRRLERRPLLLEPLEDRVVPTVQFLPIFGGTTQLGGIGAISLEESASLQSPQVGLIFAGSYWRGTQGLGEKLTLTNSVTTLVNGPYFQDTFQYGTSGVATFNPNLIFQTDSTPKLDLVDPSATFNGRDPSPPTLATFIQTTIQNAVPNAGPGFFNNVIYLVINDPTDSAQPNGPGINTGFGFQTGNVHGAYVNYQAGSDGKLALDQITPLISHELVEVIAPAIAVNDPGNLKLGDQIADGEPEAGPGGYVYRVNGVLEQAYWSQQEDNGFGAWVVPDGNSEVIQLQSGSITQSGKVVPDGIFTLAVRGSRPSNNIITLRASNFGNEDITVNGQFFEIPLNRLKNIVAVTNNSTDTVNVVSATPSVPVNIQSGEVVFLNGGGPGNGGGGGTLTGVANPVLTGSDSTGFSGTADNGVTFSNVTVLQGTGTLTGESGSSNWSLNAVTNNSTYSDGSNSLSFSGFSTLHGGPGGNTFSLQSGASGYTLQGSTGTDTLTGVSNPFLGGSNSTGFLGTADRGISFSGIDVLDGAGALTGESVASNWAVSAQAGNSSYSDPSHTLTFSGFSTLNGGSGGNSFTVGFSAVGYNLNGGTGTDTLLTGFNASLSGSSSQGFSGTLDNGIAFSGIDALTGFGTLTGEIIDSTWTVNAVNNNSTYFDRSHNLTFSGFSTLDGESGGDNFNLQSGASGYTINGLSGFNTLTGVANASLSGSNTGGFSGTADNGISFSGIEVLDGTGALTGDNASSRWSVSAVTTNSLYADNHNTLTFSGFSTLNGGTGGNTFILGAPSFPTALTINGHGSGNILVVNDQAGPADTNRAVTISPTGFTRSFPGVPTTSVTLTGIQSETFNVSGNTTVQGTALGTSTTINVAKSLTSLAGTVNLGQVDNFGLGTLQNILGPVTISGPGNGPGINPELNPDVVINDFGDTSVHNVFITPTAITNLAPAQIILPAERFVQIAGSRSTTGSTYNITGTPASDSFQVFAPGLNDVVNLQVASAGIPGHGVTQVAIGAATVNVGLGSLQAIQGFVQITNAALFLPSAFGGGHLPPAVVTVDDHTDTQQQTVTIDSNGVEPPTAPFGSIVQFSPGSIGTLNYLSGVSSTGHNTYVITGTPATTLLTLSVPGPDTVNVQATAVGTTTTVQGGTGGNHVVNVGSNSSNPPLSTLDGIQGVLNVTSGSASDVLNILDKGSTTPHTYTLTQNPATDTFTRSAPNPVTINFSSIMQLNEQKGALAGNPPAAAALAFPSTVAAGHSATMSVQLVGSGELSLSVDWGDGNPAQQSTPNLEPFRMKHKYEQPGTYHVRAVWTDSSGQSGFREMTIVVTAADEGGDD